MKDSTKFVNYIIGFILLIICIMNVILLQDLEEKTVELIELSNLENELIIVSDSIKYDTIFIEKKEIVKLPIVDTLIQTDTTVAVDSVYVEVPIELKHFSDTLVETAFSFNLIGYNCKIDSLYVKNFLSVPIQQKVPKKWYENIHLGAGLSVTYLDKFRLVPTLGIYYKLF